MVSFSGNTNIRFVGFPLIGASNVGISKTTWTSPGMHKERLCRVHKASDRS